LVIPVARVRAPGEEATRDPSVGFPGVGVPDLCGEELDEPPPCALSSLFDDGRELDDAAGENERPARRAREDEDRIHPLRRSGRQDLVDRHLGLK